jgi:hypothetical protein
MSELTMLINPILTTEPKQPGYARVSLKDTSINLLKLTFPHNLLNPSHYHITLDINVSDPENPVLYEHWSDIQGKTFKVQVVEIYLSRTLQAIALKVKLKYLERKVSGQPHITWGLGDGVSPEVSNSLFSEDNPPIDLVRIRVKPVVIEVYGDFYYWPEKKLS